MRLLPKSIHRCRRYPTKFNSGRDISGDKIRYQNRVRVPDDFVGDKTKPFFSRISPDGKIALVLDGGGLGCKGTLDGVLAIDLTLEEPAITAMVPQVGDGLETLAFHPSGRMAVVGCLGPDDAHLAVIDLTGKTPRLLYQLPFESLPEGIEFSPDGSMMFVVATRPNHIAVFDVEGFVLKRSPFVLRTGHGPSSLAVGPTFRK